MMLSVATLSLGLTVHNAPRFVTPPMAARSLCQLRLSMGGFESPNLDEPELRVRAAAIRVVAAANKFGEAQGEAAAEWVTDAMSSRFGKVDCAALLGKQMALFEECLLDEDGGAKCKELDVALAGLEEQLKKDASGPVSEFGNAKLDRAAARVRAAAAKFGPDHRKMADVWMADVRANRKLNPAALLEEQLALFGECLLDYDGDGGPARCKELEEALAALQAGLGVGGRVVPTGKFSSSDVSNSRK